MPSEPAFQRPNLEEYRDLIRKKVEHLSKDERFFLLNGMIAHSPSILIEENTPFIISELQKKGIKLIAFSNASSGNVGTINIPTTRYKELKGHCIDFSDSFNHLEEIQFKELPCTLGSHPIFSNGILLANGNTKGEVLLKFLEKAKWIPQKIIFVDDKLEYLQSVESALAQLNPKIVFTGLHYEGAKKFPSQKLDAKTFEAKWDEVLKLCLFKK